MPVVVNIVEQLLVLLSVSSNWLFQLLKDNTPVFETVGGGIDEIAGALCGRIAIRKRECTSDDTTAIAVVVCRLSSLVL